MQINKERFLALTAALAVGAIVGCSSSDKKAAPGDGTGGADAGEGAGGKSGSTGGKGGASSTKDGGGPDATSTGGAATDGGSKADSSTDGSVVDPGPCFGDSAAQIDAGGEGLTPCDLVTSECVIPDAGGDSFTSTPYSACVVMDGYLRPGVHAALRECLQKIADPCAPAADDETAACLEAVSLNACEKPKADGAVDPCVKIASGCADVSLTDCQAVMRAFTDDVVTLGILPCLEESVPLDGGACGDKFLGCIPPSLEF